MYSYEDESPRVGSKAAAAYKRVTDALISAWGQGVRQEPLSRDALVVAEIRDAHPSTLHDRNEVREKYQRGLDRLPFED